MSRVTRAVIVRLVILGVVGAALYGLSQVTISSEPKHFRIDRADIEIAVNPDASLHVARGAGLFSHEEQPAEVAEALLATLRGDG